MLNHGFAIFRVRLRADGLEKSVQRNLHIHDDLRAARQMDDQIRAQAAFFRVDGLLFTEIAVRRHARQLDDAPQSQLAPLSLDLRLLERVDQASRFLPQFLAGGGKELHFAAKAAVRFLSRGFDAGHFRAKIFQGRFAAGPPWTEWQSCAARDRLRLPSEGNRTSTSASSMNWSLLAFRASPASDWKASLSFTWASSSKRLCSARFARCDSASFSAAARSFCSSSILFCETRRSCCNASFCFFSS